jgi:hypothetical protein
MLCAICTAEAHYLACQLEGGSHGPLSDCPCGRIALPVSRVLRGGRLRHLHVVINDRVRMQLNTTHIQCRTQSVLPHYHVCMRVCLCTCSTGTRSCVFG